jgi:hypothetical protein
MAKIVCIGRASQVAHYATYFKSLGHSFSVVGSVDEYLRTTNDDGADVVLVSESFDSSAKRSVAYWVRSRTPKASIVYLFEHEPCALAHADAIANVVDLDDVIAALDAVLAAPKHHNPTIARKLT